MSHCPTASTAMEHDTARRLEPLESTSHYRRHDDRLMRHALDHGPFDHTTIDRGRLLGERTIALAAAARHFAEHADGSDTPEGDATNLSTRAPHDPAREALERTCLTVKRIAHEIGMPRATLEAYRLGTRRMPHSARVRLGTYLAAHAAMLDGLAQELIAPPAAADL